MITKDLAKRTKDQDENFKCAAVRVMEFILKNEKEGKEKDPNCG